MEESSDSITATETAQENAKTDTLETNKREEVDLGDEIQKGGTVETENPKIPADGKSNSSSNSGWGSFSGFSSFAKQISSNLEDARANLDKTVETMKKNTITNLKAAQEATKEAVDGMKLKDGLPVSLQIQGNDLNAAASKLEKTGSSLFQKAMNVIDLDSLQGTNSSQDEGFVRKPLPDVNLIYITKRVIAMDYPFTSESKLSSVSNYLNKTHGDKYLICNMSEKSYPHKNFQGQISDFKFPGHPSPPLGLLFKICSSMESWLNADPENIVVVHCMSGKGRTTTLLSCLLAWAETTWGDGIYDDIAEDGHAGVKFETPKEAMKYICKSRRMSVKNTMLPSQIGYLQYFENILEGVRPRAEPVMLKRVMIGKGVVDMMSPEDKQNYGFEGCRPYLQLYKDGKLIFSTVWQDAQLPNGTRIYSKNAQTNDGETTQIINDDSYSFNNIDCIIEGDILVRCRHIDSSSGKGIPMFRTAFYTGFVPAGEVLRLRKADLDGLSYDTRFDEEMFVDMVFAPVNTKAGYEQEKDTTTPEASNSKQVLKTEGVEVHAEDEIAFNALVASKASFWEELSQRKARRRESIKMRKAKVEAEKLKNQVRANKEKLDDMADDIPEIVEPAKPSFSILDDGDDFGSNDIDLKEFNKPIVTDDSSWQEELLALSFSGAKAKESVSEEKKTADEEEDKDHNAEEDKQSLSKSGSVDYLDDLELLEKELGIEAEK